MQLKTSHQSTSKRLRKSSHTLSLLLSASLTDNRFQSNSCLTTTGTHA